jgi:aminopeptidase-like protein
MHVPTDECKSERDTLEALFDALYPLPRSITGEGIRQSLDILDDVIPLKRESVATGTKVFDWEIPPEWEISTGQLIGPDGTVFADFEETNLAVVNYSEPIDRHLELEELRPHLHTHPDMPESTPYVTSYYERSWGFCLPYDTYESLPEGEYHAKIDSGFVDGQLDYGHVTLEGDSDEEVLLTSYLCHPSMANNELSGPLVLAACYNRLREWPNRYYTYRFAVFPETIGSITYLHQHGDHLSEVLQMGAVLTCLGGPNVGLSYKLSRQGNSLLDRVVQNIEVHDDEQIETRPFSPAGGSDERQFCSPAFDLPMGQFARTVYGLYDAYHTSADDKAFMTIDALVDSVDCIERILRITERASRFINMQPHGEPMLTRYDLYPTTNSPETRNDSSNHVTDDGRELLERALWLLNYSDGTCDVVDIADMCDQSVAEMVPVVERLEMAGLIRRGQGA